MKIIDLLKGLARAPDLLTSINEGISNQSGLLNDKLVSIADKLDEIRDALAVNRDDQHREHTAGSEPLRFANRPHYLPVPDVAITLPDPISAIMNTKEFEGCTQLLDQGFDDSLISASARAILYCLVRNLRPDLVVEIGSYRLGTTRLLAWALAANGKGRIDAVDPYGNRTAPSILASWPTHLRQIVSFHPVNSMEYFSALNQSKQRSELIFVDGNHDYEYTSFDMEAAARVISPGGFMFIDNIAQAGPFLAACDFLARHTDWKECVGACLDAATAIVPFEPGRSSMRDTQFCILRAPMGLALTSRPYSPGQLGWKRRSLTGVKLVVQSGPPGELTLQLLVRTFGHAEALQEFHQLKSVHIAQRGEFNIELNVDLQSYLAEPRVVHVTVEPWFVWAGPDPLVLTDWIVIP